jgi:hypothetical protein
LRRLNANLKDPLPSSGARNGISAQLDAQYRKVLDRQKEQIVKVAGSSFNSPTDFSSAK